MTSSAHPAAVGVTGPDHLGVGQPAAVDPGVDVGVLAVVHDAHEGAVDVVGVEQAQDVLPDELDVRRGSRSQRPTPSGS